jgi:hypothetical protein
MGHFSVRVVRNDGEPAEGIGVVIDFVTGGRTGGHTDSNGWVEFHSYLDSPGTISVNGEDMGEHSLSSGKTYSFTV